jgi:hypothetical protein
MPAKDASKIKLAHEMGKDLKAIQSAGMVVELRTAGYVAWANSLGHRRNV